MKIFKITLLLFFSMSVFNTVLAQDKDDKPFKPTKKMESIVPFVSKMTVKKGETIYYSGSQHSSVGEEVSCYSSNDKVLLRTMIDKQYVKKIKKGERRPSGADEMTVYFVFEAKSVGKSTIIIKEYFRGSVQNEFEIEITVEP